MTTKTQIKYSEEGFTLSRPLQDCPWRALALLSRHETYQVWSVQEYLLVLEGMCCRGYGTHYGMQGKGILGLHKIYYRRLGEEPKVGERMDLGDLWRNKYGENKGVRRL